MDLMIDCMPLYEMIEDDMKNIINCNVSSSSSSPSCLSDEEQLALTSCSMFDDLFFLSIQQPQQQQQQYAPNETDQQQQQQQQQITYSNLSCVSNDTLVETLEQLTNDSNNVTNNNTNQTPVDNTTNNSNQQFNNNFYSNTCNNLSFNDSFCSSSLSSSTSSAACSPISANGGCSNSGNNSASPLSLSLSSSSLFDALANTTFNSPPPTTTNNNGVTPNSVGSSNTNSTCSSSISSPSTTPLSHQYSNFNNSTSSFSGLQTKQESQVNSKYMDSIYYNNVNLYHVINPMDLNRNYNQQQQFNNNNSSSTLHDILQSNGNDQLPTHRIKTISIPKQQLTGSTYTHQVAKRGKFSHNTSPNSDGESSLSNESDSNSSIGSSELTKKMPINNNNNNANGNNYSKPLIIATKIESFQLKNVTNQVDQTTATNNPVQPINVNTPTTQINLIKINGPKENTFYSTTSGNQFGNNNSNNLKVPVTTKINSIGDSQSSNHKTIIQYKQLVANNGLNVNKPQAQQSQSTGLNTIINLNSGASLTVNSNGSVDSNAKVFPKPPYSYSCLIAMALRNSDSGNLPVSDIYEFIIENFPYYKTARDGWKNSIRHNLSLNKCFEKIENPTNGSKKGCLWALNPDKCKKLEEECKRCRQRDPVNIRLSMSRPDDLNKIERGEQRLKKFNSTGAAGARKPTLDANTNSNNTAGLSVQPAAVTTNGQISLSPAPNNSNAGGGNNSCNSGSGATSHINLSDDSFLLDWTNKNSSVILKEEDQYFDDSDIKFDPILLTGLNQSTRNNI